MPARMTEIFDLFKAHMARLESLGVAHLASDQLRTAVATWDGTTRQRMPLTRNALSAQFTIVGAGLDAQGEPRRDIDVYVAAGEFEDGRIGEVFVEVAKQGSKIHGLMDLACTYASMCLQLGASLADVSDKARHIRFAPDGMVKGHPTIRTCTSIPDLAFKWIETVYDRETGRRTEPGARARAELASQLEELEAKAADIRAQLEASGGVKP